MNRNRSRWTAALIALAAVATTAARAAEPKPIAWTGKDIAGQAVSVPAEGRITVMVFAMAEQDRSLKAMAMTQEELAGVDGLRMLAVVSGEQATIDAPRVAEKGKWPAAMVADSEYKLSGAASVHVWPTVVIVNADGAVVGHVAGLPVSLAKDVHAYVDFAAGRIDADALKAALASESVVASTREQAAARHVEVADRLIARQQYDQAQRELERALELNADSEAVQLGLVRVAILRGRAADAVKQLDAMAEPKAAAWRRQTLRGRALLALGQVEQAKAVLTEAVKLNPQPAEAYYLLGRTHEALEQWREAADAYRSAYEHKAENAGVGG